MRLLPTLLWGRGWRCSRTSWSMHAIRGAPPQTLSVLLLSVPLLSSLRAQGAHALPLPLDAGAAGAGVAGAAALLPPVVLPAAAATAVAAGAAVSSLAPRISPDTCGSGIGFDLSTSQMPCWM